MNWLLMLFLTVMSAYSLDPQEGNGGNICVQNKKWRSWGKVYRTLDELTLPDMAPMMNGVMSAPLYSEPRHNSELRTADLTKTEAGQIAWRRLTWFEFRHPELAHEFQNYFLLLNRVFVSDKVFRAVGADYTTTLKCQEGTAEAAMRTDIYGSTVVSSQAWNKLQLNSQVILLLHETIRLAQMFSGWGERIDNRSLQSFTMYLFDLRDDLLFYSNHEDRFIYNLYKFKDFTVKQLKDDIIRLEETSENLLASHNFSQAIRVGHDLSMRDWMLGYKLRNWEESKHFRFVERMSVIRQDARYLEFLESYLPFDIEEY